MIIYTTHEFRDNLTPLNFTAIKSNYNFKMELPINFKIKLFNLTRPLLWYHTLVSYLMPHDQGDKDRDSQISVQMWPQRSPMVKSAMALYQKIHVTRNTIYVESFMLFMKKCTNFWGVMLQYLYYCSHDT